MPARLIFIAAIVVLISACAVYVGGDRVTSVPAPADLVIRDVKVYDPIDGFVGSAIAIQNEVIIAIGDEDTIRSYEGRRTRVLDADGGLLIPGIQDAHGHIANLGFDLDQADLRGAASEEELVSRVAAFAKNQPDSWILGRGWDQNLWPKQQFPTRAPLDAATGSRPAYLTRIDGHAALVNSVILQMAGIDKNTKDPAGGRILRDDRGEPTGVLVDAAMDLIDRIRPGRTSVDRERAFLRAQKVLLASGITAVHDAGLSREDQAVLQDLEERGKLTMRIYGMASAGQIPPRPFSNRYFELRAVKAYADGALGSRGAALLAPYADEPGQSGLLVTPEAELLTIAEACLKRGFQLCTHAIGDRGNRVALDVYQSAFAKNNIKTSDNNLRWRIEHCQVVAPGDFERYKTLGLIASMQPTHCTSDGPWAPARIGNERMAGAYAWRRFMDLNIPIAFGSDFPVEKHDPRLGIVASITRRPPEDLQHSPFAGSPLTIHEAVKAFTTDAAYASFHEHDRGRIQPGYAADLTIFDRDFIQSAAADDVLRANVVWTIVAGKIVYN
ncbi:MAG: amidohydrolase [Planctomycetota bacterium]